MLKVFNQKNLLILCWIEAILYLIQAFLKHYFFEMDLLYPAESVVFLGIVITAVVYYAKERPAIKVSVDIIMLLVMFLWLILSCAVRTISGGEDFFTSNSNYISDFETIFIVYLLGRYSAKTEIPKRIRIVLQALLIVVSALMAYILFIIFTNRSIDTPNSGFIGMRFGTAFQINCHRNYVGAGAMILVLLCLFLIFRSKHTGLKILYSVLFAIHYIALIISSSRTGLISAVVGFAAMITVMVYNRCNAFSTGKRVLVSVGSSLISGAIFFLMRYPIYALYSYIVGNFGGNSLNSRVIMDASAATLSSRTVIWRYCMQIITTPRTLLTGVTPEGVAGALLDVSNNGLRYPHAHNQILEVGVALGIPALIAFAVWLVIIAIRSLKVLITGKRNTLIMVVPFLILAIMLDNMAERYCLFYGYFISYIFFFLCGYISNFGKVKK